MHTPARRFDPAAPGDRNVPLLVNGQHTSFVAGYAVGVVQITPEMAEVHGGPVGPALVLHLSLVHGHADRGPEEVRAIIMPLPEQPTAAGLPGGRQAVVELRDTFDEALTAVLEVYDDPSILAESTRRAHERNVAAGFVPGAPRPHCPGCGAALFGEVALRGGCLACYPDLPPEEAPVPTLRWPERPAGA